MATKIQDIHGQLLEMATSLGPSARLPTVERLRRDLNVSNTTLDNALTQLENRNIIVRRHGLGIFVSPRLFQKCVGLVCEPAFFSAGMSPFWQKMVESARVRASTGGEAFRFYLALRSSDGASPVHDDLIDDVTSKRIDGVLFLGSNDAAQAWLKEHQVPTVVFAGYGDYRVEVDMTQLVTVAGRHLVERGCRRPALLCHWETEMHPPLINKSIEIRAFERLFDENGLTQDSHLLWDARFLGDRVKSVPKTHQEQGYQAVMNLFSDPSLAPDGLLSTDDMMTRGALAGLQELGLKPGQDVEVVTHINRGSAVLENVDQNISFVEIDPAEIVASMFSQLEILMDNKVPQQQCISIEARHKN